MKVTIILLAPLIFAALGLLMWAAFRKRGWNNTFARLILWCSIISLTIYVAGYAASLIGDKIHGPADSFDWSPVYFVTLPMMFGGWWLSLLACVAAIVGVITRYLKRGRKTANQAFEAIGDPGSPQPQS